MYKEINTTTCCHANMCTECFLQVRPQKECGAACPFCASDQNFSIVLKKKPERIPQLSISETSTTNSETSCGSSAALASNTSKTNSSTSTKKKSAASVAPHTPPTKREGFGSELEKSDHFRRIKVRTESFASSDGNRTPKVEQEMIQSIAMTAKERQQMEERMKAQHNHPLMLQLESEAQERRLENDRAYQSSSSNHSRSSRGFRRNRASRNWEQMTGFFGGQQMDEIDDMTALETALLYSRLTDASSSAAGSSNQGEGRIPIHRDQLEGFPLLRTLLTGQLGDEGEGTSNRSSFSSRSSRRSRRSNSRHSNNNMGDVALATAGMMMQGISEEEQIAMAIAASMQDQQQTTTSSSDNASDETTEDENDTETNDSDGSTSNSNTTEENAAESSSSSEESEVETPAIKPQGSGDEASTITELARVVTDNADTMMNHVAA